MATLDVANETGTTTTTVGTNTGNNYRTFANRLLLKKSTPKLAPSPLSSKFYFFYPRFLIKK
jgi:hypothetical protein